MSRIPKTIFQTFKNDNFSEQFREIIKTWKDKNPTYEYRFYSDEDCDTFIQANFDDRTYSAYKKILPGAYKADMWRYCILYMYGGVYVDIDTVCMNPIDMFLTPEIECMTVIDFNTGKEKHTLFNTFLATVPKFRVCLDCIQQIVYNVENNLIPTYKVDFCGPGLLGRKVNRYMNLPELSSYVGKQGLHTNIYLLAFEEKTEYVKDTKGNILLQNKNGNQMLSYLYAIECRKANIVSWVTNRPF